ncbi:hypothetical protein EV360DRAFT_75228, partial [Lentinula raphanica]
MHSLGTTLRNLNHRSRILFRLARLKRSASGKFFHSRATTVPVLARFSQKNDLRDAGGIRMVTDHKPTIRLLSKLVIDLRPYLFQCGAAIYQHVPDSNIFKLPAFMDSNVMNWMKTEFPTQLSLIQAKAGSPVDLQRIQNESLRLALEE